MKILTEFHLEQIKSKEDLAQDIITKASHVILPEFIANIPNIGNKMEAVIENLIEETSRSTKHYRRKRKNNNPSTTPANKRPKQQKNVKSPSTKEGHPKKKIKSLN